jgi:pimeloyl-ACP methyl ester carboxylesterase/DNA-binding CsgD family transcriptional regulator
MCPWGDWKRPDARAFWQDLTRERRVISFDRRGVGASQREVEDLTLEAHLADLAAVVDHLGLERFDLWGIYDSTLVCAAYAARQPERVSRLVLWMAYARARDRSNPEYVQGLVSLIRGNWMLATRAMAELIYPSGPLEAQTWAAGSIHESASPEVAAMYVESNESVDVQGYLPHVQAPTLVIHRQGHPDVPVVPQAAAEAVAALIPDAQLVILEGDSVSPYVNHQQYLSTVMEFLGHEAPVPEAPPLPAHMDGLTAREVDVVRLIALGRSNREIARELIISVNTVDRHVSNILTKTGASNRAEAVAYAARHQLVR